MSQPDRTTKSVVTSGRIRSLETSDNRAKNRDPKSGEQGVLSPVALAAMGLAGVGVSGTVGAAKGGSSLGAAGPSGPDLNVLDIGQVAGVQPVSADSQASVPLSDLVESMRDLVANGRAVQGELVLTGEDQGLVNEIASAQLPAGVGEGVELAAAAGTVSDVSGSLDGLMLAQADTASAGAASAQAAAASGAAASGAAAGASTVSAGALLAGLAVLGVAASAAGSSSDEEAKDTTAPAKLTLSLRTDTGADATDRLTSDGRVNVTGAESGASVQYSTDGTNWSSSFTAVEGANTVYARQTDAAGNVSEVSSALTFTLDTSAPLISALDATAGSNQITLTYDTALDAANAPLVAAFVVTSGGTDNDVTAVAIDGAVVTLTLARAVEAGQISVEYTDPTSGNDANAVQDAAGNDAVGFVQGTVADGYVRGAQIYVDANRDGVAQASEKLNGVVTDAKGNFFLPDTAPKGPIIAVGGINIDTGLPNTVPLKAPEGATTVNPLTTLVQAAVETSTANGGTALTPAEAAAQVADALGLGSGVNLLTFDPLAELAKSPESTVALAAQKAAATVATVIALAAQGDAADAKAVTDSLAKAVVQAASSETPIDLASETVLAQAVSSVITDVDALASFKAEASAAATQIQAAEDLTSISQAQSEVLDSIKPSATTASVDNELTNDNSPAVKVTLDVVSLQGGAAVVGDQVQLTLSGNLVGSPVTLAAADVKRGYVMIDLPEQTDAVYTIGAKVTDGAGNVSDAGTPVIVTIDTAKPNAPVISASSDDTGSSSSDGITKDTTQTLTISAEAGSTVEVFDGANLLGQATEGANGVFTFATASLSEMAHAFTAKATDGAGNVSDASVVVNVTVDTTVTTPTAQLSTDTGSSASDLVTNDASMSFSTPAADVVRTFTVDGGAASDAYVAPTSNGAHSVVVTDTDTAGNVATATVSFTLDTQAQAPVVALATNSGDITDTISNSGALTAPTGVESGAKVEFSIDGGDWSETYAAPTIDGAYSVAVRQTDVAGNTSAATTVGFTLDTTGPSVTSLSPTDGGKSLGLAANLVVSASEALAKGTGTITLAEADGTVVETFDVAISDRITVNGNQLIIDPTDDLVKDQAYEVTATGSVVTDLAGNDFTDVGGNDGWQFTGAGASVTIDMVTGDDLVNKADWDAAKASTNTVVVTGTITAEAAILAAFTKEDLSGSVTGPNGSGSTPLTSGFTYSYTLGTSATWSVELPASMFMGEGSLGLSISILGTTGAAAAVAGVATSSVAFDTVVLQPSVSLQADTGAGAPDGVTSNGSVSVTGKETGAQIEYSKDGTNWGSTFTAAEGANSVQVRQTDAAGNVSGASTPLTFTLDSAAPGTPVIQSVSVDSGIAADRRTNDTTPVFVVKAESGAVIKAGQNGVETDTAYTVSELSNGDGSSNYTVTFTGELADGGYGFAAIDLAGNKSASALAGTDGPNKFKIDSSAPATPTILSITDNSGNAADRLTNDTMPVIVVKAESDTVIKVGTAPDSPITSAYSVTEEANGDGTSNYRVTFTEALGDGGYGFASIDAAGNKSASADAGVDGPNKFKIDNLKPAAAIITAVDADSGKSAADRVTNDSTPVLTVTAESGAKVGLGHLVGGVPTPVSTSLYSVVEGASSSGLSTYSITATSAMADDVYAVVVVDAAGNQSVVDTSTFDTSKFKIDTTAPVLSVETPLGNDFAFQFKFDGPVNGFDANDVLAPNGVVGALSVIDANVGSYTVVVTPLPSTVPVDFSINVAAGAAQDAAGNTSTADAFNKWVMFDTAGNDVLTLSGGHDVYVDLTGGGTDAIKIANAAELIASGGMDYIEGFDSGDKIDLSAILGVGGSGYTGMASVDSGFGFVEIRNITLANTNTGKTVVKFDVTFDSASVEGQKIEGAVIDLSYSVANLNLGSTLTKVTGGTYSYVDDLGETVTKNVWAVDLNEIFNRTDGKMASLITLDALNPIVDSTGKVMSVQLVYDAVLSQVQVGIDGAGTSVSTSAGTTAVEVGASKIAGAPVLTPGSSGALEIVTGAGTALGEVTDNQLHYVAVYNQEGDVTHLQMKYDTNPAAGGTALSEVLALDFNGDVTGKLTPDSFILL